jgi:hypothetical protein
VGQACGDVAQVVRACGSYPQCPGFKSLHRHQYQITLHHYLLVMLAQVNPEQNRYARLTAGKILLILSKNKKN